LVDFIVWSFDIVYISDFVSVVVAICGIGSLSSVKIVGGLHLGVNFGLNRSLVKNFGLSLLEWLKDFREMGYGCWGSFLGGVGQFGLDNGFGLWDNNNSRFVVMGGEMHLQVLFLKGHSLLVGLFGALFLGGSLGSGIEWISERIHDLGTNGIGGEGIGLLLLLLFDGVFGLIHKLFIFLIFCRLLLFDEIGLFLLLLILLLFEFLQFLGLGSSNGFLLLLLLGGSLSFSFLLFSSKLLLLFLGLKLGSLLFGFNFLLFFLLGVFLGLNGCFGFLFGEEVGGNLLGDSFLFFLLNQCLLLILSLLVALGFTLLFGFLSSFLRLKLFLDEFLGELLFGQFQGLFLSGDFIDLLLQLLVELGNEGLGLVEFLVQIGDLFEILGNKGYLLLESLIFFGQFFLNSLKLSLALECGCDGFFLLFS